MQRELFDNYIRNLEENSLRRACYIVREYLRFSKRGGGSAVSEEEYKDALKILLAYSYESSKEKDINVDLYYCESDCSKNNGTCGFCEGEFQLGNSHVLCKHYSDSNNI